MTEETQEMINKKPPNSVGTEEKNRSIVGIFNPLALGDL